MGLSGTIVWMSVAGAALVYLVAFGIYMLIKSRRTGEIPAAAVPSPGQDDSKTVIDDATESMHIPGARPNLVEHGAIAAGFKSLVGGRKQQEDSLRVDVTRSGSLMAVVCDGMGGLARGDVTSLFALERLFAYAQDFSASENIKKLLRQAAVDTDFDIADINKASGSRSGTTAVAVLCFENSAYWLSVGDSRIYFFRDHQLLQLTRDHNYELEIKLAIASGEAVSPEAMQAERPDALISYLGMGGLSLADTGRIDLKSGDTILICSDGLFKTLSDLEIAQILDSFGSNVSGGANALCTSAVSRGGTRQDNTSVIVIRAK